MGLFTPLVVPRTNVAASNEIWYEDGKAGQGFYTPSSGYLGWQMVPHDNKWKDGKPSFMSPIMHYHLLQSETFHVVSGSGYWFLGGKKIRLGPGDEITIPACRAHTFESIPNDKQEPLLVKHRYDSQRWEMEERFFRNCLTYMDDCRKIGVEPSVLQLCVFITDCWMAGDLVPFPGGDYVRCAVNTLFVWIMALIGMTLFGYKRSYIEYYDPELSRKRILKEEKKAK